MLAVAEQGKLPYRYLSMAVVGVLIYVPLAQSAEHMTFNRDVLSSILKWYTICSVGQAVKTPPFHGGNTGSNPVPSTNKSVWWNW